MSLATVCSSFWLRVGLGAPTPGVWIGSSEATQQEVVEFAREALRMVVEAHEWQALVRTHTVALASEIEQTIALPADFGRLVPDTVRVTNQFCAIAGPLSEAQYEDLKRPIVRATTPAFRIARGSIDLLNAVAPGGDLTLRYVSAHAVQNGATGRDTWQADTDVALLDERLVTLAMIALWRDARGLNAEAAVTLYTAALARAKAQDRPQGVMPMSGPRRVGGDTASTVIGFTVETGVLA